MERLTKKVVCNLPDEVLEKLGIADVPKEDYEIKGTNGELCRETCEQYECDNCPIKKAIDKLADYEQAEEDGLLIRLPCKVGTTVYIVNRYWIDEGHICGIAESDDVDCFCYKVYCDPDCYDMVALVEFNKTWFLTEAEAEQALSKMKGV